jgi:hypothetical protein
MDPAPLSHDCLSVASSIEGAPPHSDVSDDIDLLHRWKEIARTEQRAHDLSFRYYHTLNGLYIAGIVILGSVSAFLNIILAVVTPPAPPNTCSNGGKEPFNITLNLVSGAISIFSSALTAIYNSHKVAFKEVDHLRHIHGYGDLLRDIYCETHLSKIGGSAFSSKAEFLKHVNATLDKLADGAPPIPDCIRDKLAKTDGGKWASATPRWNRE